MAEIFTDLKERSDMALKKAVQIAHQFGSKITLLNVHEAFMENEVFRWKFFMYC